ncbi:hypothetical protein NLJ89_g5829 [Agrocybe chaxingu]|uniref:ATP-dependent DNA helicase n=1 Tax=Agrocybe chaxingu TaxID=84603 RepID=A0A9W8MTA0_9AGAR|nr:hypothetical protein NLJ89_g5829 [Agrocybe chaxingu]
MSSDDYFDGIDDFDASALQQINAIEAAHYSPAKRAVQSETPPASPPLKRPAALNKEPSLYDISFDVDESELAKLDTFIEDAYKDKVRPVAGPSKFSRASSSSTLQTTLFGEVIQPTASSSKPRSQIQRSKSSTRNLFGQQARKTKVWDQTAFSKTGKQGKSRGKGKANADGDESGEEAVEFEQFPAPSIADFGIRVVLDSPPPPMKLAPDLLEAKHWIYPINRPKRDYQFNIVKNSLFENTLVALPTGLGKTFIAGVVMLNYYRWFPEGKVVFVAPTKPLVAQQVTACHETCGIPGRDSAELTGEVPRATRMRYWEEKRVFFMTPQTLYNDLLKETCDIHDIVLLVVDEAHRATGDYSYNLIVRLMMAKNPHFRVLALTATPGNNVDSVQLLINGLHISRIEIRNEESLDLKPYIHKKVQAEASQPPKCGLTRLQVFQPHLIAANENVAKIRTLIANPLMKPMQAVGLLRPNESPLSMHPYRPQALSMELKDPSHKRFYGSLSMLSKLARAMLYLLTGSIGSCYTFMYDVSQEPADEDDGKKKSKGKKLKDDPNFHILMAELESQRARGFDIHPKVEKLKTILIQHFGSRLAEQDGEGTDNLDESRIMVFSSYRAVVDEIVEELDKERPLIRATRFIGQGADKQGKKGLAQKQQLEVIKKFMAGEYNVLVATSIGEEGLDIGEIDVAVCYDADKAPTRMVNVMINYGGHLLTIAQIQRFGRTGRKRTGTIHALLAEDREEMNIEKAEATYKEVQKLISKGEMYELYSDVERLIPDHMKPECIEKMVEIEKYVREEGRKRASPKIKGATQGVKRKRNDDIGRNIPDGASSGFVSVRDLVIKGAKKPKKATLSKNFDADGQDDETDEDIMSGRILASRRTQSAAASTSNEKPAKKTTLRRSTTIAGSKPKARKKKLEQSLSQFSRQGQDDSDDIDIEYGAVAVTQTRHFAPKKQADPAFESSDEMDVDEEMHPKDASPQVTPSPSRPRPSLKREVDSSVIELCDSSDHDRPALEPQRSRSTSPLMHSSPPEQPRQSENMGWLVDDDDDTLNFEIIDSSPSAQKKTLTFQRVQIGDESIEVSQPTSSKRMLAEDSVEFVEPDSSLQPLRKRRIKQIWSDSSFPRVLSPVGSPGAHLNNGKSRSSTPPKKEPSPTLVESSSPLYPPPKKSNVAMLPPPLPDRLFGPNADNGFDLPEPSYPVRPGANQAKRRRIIFDEPESSALEMPSPSQRRLYKLESTPVRLKTKRKAKRAKPSLLAKNVDPVFDGEAAHSGDETSEGHSSEDEENDEDHAFIQNSPVTQVSPSYEQTQIYRRSLMTQAEDGPAFVGRLVRPKPFGRIDGPRRLHSLPSSSPPPPDEELDNYEFGSFIVHDDADISFEN